MDRYFFQDNKGCLFIVGLGVLLVLGIAPWPYYGRVQEDGEIVRAISNVRQIFFGLELYKKDNAGELPPGDSANEVFRQLVVSQLVDKESIFGASPSFAVPDGDIGTNPEFKRMLERDENHWMIIRWDRWDREGFVRPFLVECADTSSGKPMWHPERAGKLLRGRTWSGGRVVVAMTDGTVTTWKTVGNQPTSQLENGESVIDFSDSEIPLLDVEWTE